MTPGMLHVKAYRRQLITLFGKFNVSPSRCEHLAIVHEDGQRSWGYHDMPGTPYIEAEITSMRTSKFPREIISATLELVTGKIYYLKDATWSVDEHSKKFRMRFEGSYCEEVNL